MTSACSSSMSIQKSCGTNSGTNISGSRSNHNEIVCSSKPSSCFLQRKKPVNPLSVSIRPPQRIDGVRQRVRSAKMVKIRALQSQLNDANYHLMELAQENRALKNTERLQGKALNNYEGVNANLPRLLKSHEEENRALVEKNKVLKRQLREVTDTLKVRDDELLSSRDQLRHLTTLAKDKHLEEREQLRNSLDEAKELIKNYETEISLLNRKLMLEVKNCRQKVAAEANKYKKCQVELAQAIGEIDRQNESKGRLLRKRFELSPRGQKKSTSNLSSSASKETLDSDVKLEPIKKRSSAESRNSLVSPVEKIKARLSTTEARPHKIEDFSDILEKLTMEEEFLKKSLQSGIKGSKMKPTKLETIVKSRNGVRPKIELPPANKFKTKSLEKDTEQDAYKKYQEPEDDVDEDVADEEFEEPELEQVQSRRDSFRDRDPEMENNQSNDGALSDADEVVHHHLKSLEESEREFKKVQDELKEIEKYEAEMEQKHIDADNEQKNGVVLKEEDYALVNEIWNEEYSFRKAQRERTVDIDTLVTTDNNTSVTKKDPIVALENKRKLLATLREIDNGNSIDAEGKDKNVDDVNTDSRKSRLMKELFG